MKCEEARELFSAHADGELAGAARETWESHMGSCAECTEHLARFERAVGAVRALPRHPVPRAFAAETLARAAVNRGAAAAPAVTVRGVPAEVGERRAWSWRVAGVAAAAILAGFVALAVHVELRFRGRERADELYAQARLETETRMRDGLDALRGEIEVVRRGQDQDVASMAAVVAGMETRLAQAVERAEQVEGRLARSEQAIAVRLSEQRAAEREWAAAIARIEALLAAAPPPSSPNTDNNRVTAATTARADANDDELEPAENAPVQMLRDGSRPQLVLDLDHADTIAKLFELYESGHPEWSPLAAAMLDQHFRVVARADLERELARQTRRGIQGTALGFLALEEDNAPAQGLAESARMGIYKDYWRSQVALKQGAPVTLREIKGGQ